MGGTYKSLGSFSIETQKFENSHLLFIVCVGYPLDSSGKVHGVCSVRVIWIITHWKKNWYLNLILLRIIEAINVHYD